MQTECTPKLLEFEAVERRSIVASFDGGNITSNAGALLLGQVDRGLGLVWRFADCFVDRRGANGAAAMGGRISADPPRAFGAADR